MRSSARSGSCVSCGSPVTTAQWGARSRSNVVKGGCHAVRSVLMGRAG
ncbi:MAG: hypothetical protein R3A52_28905 [Polyangiales bacterium]